MGQKFFSYVWICLTLTLFAPSAQGDTFRLGQADENFLHQLAIPILEEAYRRNGHELTTVSLPSGRTAVMANAGDTDGEILRTRKILSKFQNLRIVDVPIVKNAAYAVTASPFLRVTSWEDLKLYKVGIVNGLVAIEKKTAPYSPYKANSYAQALTLLRHGRVDVLVLPVYNAMGELKKVNKETKLYVQLPALHEKDMYHFVHQKNEHLIKPLTKTLGEMKAQGYFEDRIQEVIAESQLNFVGTNQ